MDKIKTHEAIIEHLGGVFEVAEMIKVNGESKKAYQKVWRWKDRNRIPSPHWAMLINKAHENDKTLSLAMLLEATSYESDNT